MRETLAAKKHRQGCGFLAELMSRLIRGRCRHFSFPPERAEDEHWRLVETLGSWSRRLPTSEEAGCLYGAPEHRSTEYT